MIVLTGAFTNTKVPVVAIVVSWYAAAKVILVSA
jgi:hypothetical protein